MKIEVYGASDDLIEVSGHICEEFNPHGRDGEPDYLGFSDGTVLRVVYDKGGMWRITPVARGSAEYKKQEGIDSVNDYSDKVTLTGDLHWVVFGSRCELRMVTGKQKSA